MAKSKKSAEIVEKLAEQLSADIRLGVFDFGQRLKLSELQERYSASQFHVRQALTQLKSLRLVEHQQNFGFRIVEQSTHEREDLRSVRTTLERSAVPLIVAKATSADVTRLQKLAKRFEDAAEAADRQKLVSANLDFHEAFYGISSNRILEELIAELRERSVYGTTGRWRKLEGIRASAAEHYQMVDAIQGQDPVLLDKLVYLHIQWF